MTTIVLFISVYSVLMFNKDTALKLSTNKQTTLNTRIMTMKLNKLVFVKVFLTELFVWPQVSDAYRR